MNAVPDEYRVRVYRTRRGVHRFWGYGRCVWAVEVDYLTEWSQYGDQPVRRLWTDADDIDCAISLGVETARGIHEDAVANRLPLEDDDVELITGPLVIHVGGRIVVDERVAASTPGGAA